MKSNFHGGNFIITSITITPGGSTPGDITVDNFFAIHGIGQLIGWNILVTVGYISARFLKHYPWWLILHFIGGTIPSLFSIGIIISTLIRINTS
jgi:hypothetical protein